MALTEARRQQLGSIVQQMVANKESDVNINAVVNSFKNKYQNEEVPQQQSPQGPGLLGKLKAMNDGLRSGIIDFNKGILKGAGDTVIGMSELGQKTLGRGVDAIVSKATGKDINTIDSSLAMTEMGRQYTKADNTAQAIGKGVEKVAEMMVAGNAMAGKAAGATTQALNITSKSGKVARALPEMASIITDALTTGTITLAQTGGDTDQAKTNAKWAVAVPLAFKAIGAIGNVASSITKKVASRLSGVPVAAIDEAYSNPKYMAQAIKEAADRGDGAVAHLADEAEAGLNNLKAIRAQAYKANLEAVKGVKGADLSLDGLKPEINSTLQKFGIVLDDSGQFADDAFKHSPLPSSMQSDIKEIVGRINTWDDMTPTGVDDLREVIASYRKTGADSAQKQFNKIIGSFKNSVQGYLESKVPETIALNAQYAAQSKVIDDVVDTLSAGKDKPQVVARKLMNIFSPQNPTYREAVKKLGAPQAKKLFSDIAATSMYKWMPDDKLTSIISSGVLGAGALLHPASWPGIVASMAASSPRLVGTAAIAAGTAAPITGAIASGAEELIKRAPSFQQGFTQASPEQPQQTSPQTIEPQQQTQTTSYTPTDQELQAFLAIKK